MDLVEVVLVFTVSREDELMFARKSGLGVDVDKVVVSSDL